MASALPHCPSVSYTPKQRSTIELGEGSCRQTFEALASETAREIVKQLAVEPATASELATRIDLSIQNVGYHLTQLHEAGLVVEAGVWYSERGKEMSVYAPWVEELVVHVPTPSEST
jgi:DNA-binding transcriptional ArsR family regulator